MRERSEPWSLTTTALRRRGERASKNEQPRQRAQHGSRWAPPMPLPSRLLPLTVVLLGAAIPFSACSSSGETSAPAVDAGDERVTFVRPSGGGHHDAAAPFDAKVAWNRMEPHNK